MDNRNEGRIHYLCSPEDREWFHEQWRIWPERAHKDRTTNLSFLYGGVLVYRELNEGKNPEMSRDFQVNIEWLDKRG